MLDALLLKCTSLAHFQSVLAVVDQVATLLKTSFNGPLEQEVIDIITNLLAAQATTLTPPPQQPVSK
jgi:hypothetical protein